MKSALAALVALLAMLGPVRAETLRVVISDDSQSNYMETLVRVAFEAAGQAVTLEIAPSMPQPRVEAALRAGEISLHPFLRTPARDARLIPVPTPVTQGLMGRRILLIRPGDQAKFSGVRSLADLQALRLVGGFGAGWYDLEIWRANGLPAHGQGGDWQMLYGMVASGQRDIDYLALGAAQVAYEAGQHPEVVVESGLVLDYDADVMFYASPYRPDVAGPLARGMAAIAADGRLGHLIERYFGPSIRALGLGQRRVIQLALPE